MEVKLVENQRYLQQENSQALNEINKSRERQSKPGPINKVKEKMQSLKQINNKSQSPVSVRLIKTTSKIIDQPPTPLEQISSTQLQIHNLIDELDFKLKSNYHHKQTNLIENYRQQLIQAHKDLIELKNNTNEQQIKNEMNEKFLQMKKQRLELIQNNMFYSNKCIQYKKLLQQKVAQGKQLEKQIQFLEKQINNSNQKKVQILSQLYQNNSPLKNYPIQFIETNPKSQKSTEIKTLRKQTQLKNHFQNTPQKKTSYSTHANTQILKKPNISSNSSLKNKAHLLNKMPQINNQVKKIFQEKLIGNQNFQTDRSNLSIRNPNILKKLSALNSLTQTKQQIRKQQSQIQSLFLNSVEQVRKKRGSKKQIALFKSEQFTDFEKKEIMKAFLGKQEVKQFIYNAIFDKTDDQALFTKRSAKEKVKIVATQL